MCIGGQYLIIFLTYDIKNYCLSYVNSLIFDILRRITAFADCHSVFFVVVQNDVTTEVFVTFNVACELSQAMGKTEFSSNANNKTNSYSVFRKTMFSSLRVIELVLSQ